MLIVQPTALPLHRQPKPHHGSHQTSPTSSTVVFMESPDTTTSGQKIKNKSLFTLCHEPSEIVKSYGDHNNDVTKKTADDDDDDYDDDYDDNNNNSTTNDPSLKITTTVPKNEKTFNKGVHDGDDHEHNTHPSLNTTRSSFLDTKMLGLPSKNDVTTDRPLSVPDQTLQSKEKLKEINKIISESYQLVWGNSNNNNKDLPDYQMALSLLHQAMEMQQQCLGKNHTDVGWTVNFIGTTYWRMSQVILPAWSQQQQQQQQQYCKTALKYFLEARRIFCKSTPPTIATPTSPSSSSPVATTTTVSGQIKSIDRRIECILTAQIKWTSQQVSQFLSSLQQMMDHELLGDQYKARGDTQRATNQYRKARQHGDILKKYIR
jgi:tetratricopeptide (TPR) repeat protein